ncbi:unnamed protein product [Didymodactylos carnosus]|uniref:Uncharacterized protein n=1 Tax=Didymodactylos carnosus TaxID=1234261 RepID=A0A815Z4S4_9BILA|nr:unnamed protein product [Didymodactylos carnosus]CAF4446039.1 unnamed protein product [Didymodactylos carnosus]
MDRFPIILNLMIIPPTDATLKVIVSDKHQELDIHLNDAYFHFIPAAIAIVYNLFETLHSFQIKFSCNSIDITLDTVSSTNNSTTTIGLLSFYLSNIDIELNFDKFIVKVTVGIDIYLFNKNKLVWEPFLEPNTKTIDGKPEPGLVWTITANINDTDHHDLFNTPPRTCVIAVNRLFNVTLTKSNIEQLQYIYSLFTNPHVQVLVSNKDRDIESHFWIHNVTGYDIVLNNLEKFKVHTVTGVT